MISSLTSEIIQHIRPSLHHGPAFLQVFRSVVDSPNAGVSVGKLLLDQISSPSSFVEQGGGCGSESVSASLIRGISQSTQSSRYRGVTHRSAGRPDRGEEIFPRSCQRLENLQNFQSLLGKGNNVGFSPLHLLGRNSPEGSSEIHLCPFCPA